MAGGGHSPLGSRYGLGADQALSIEVVTADGRFVTASPDENRDLFYAMLGGGPSELYRTQEPTTNWDVMLTSMLGTYGVLTSAVVKAYVPTPIMTSALAFSLGANSFGDAGNYTPPGNLTLPSNWTAPGIGYNSSRPSNASSMPAPTVSSGLNQSQIFWEGIRKYLVHAKNAVDNGGVTWTYLSKTGPNSYSFSTSFEMPGFTPKQVFDFVQPLYTALNKLGIPVVNPPKPAISISYNYMSRTGVGDAPGNSRFSSRLWPRANWDNATILNATFQAIRELVEGEILSTLSPWHPRRRWLVTRADQLDQPGMEREHHALYHLPTGARR